MTMGGASMSWATTRICSESVVGAVKSALHPASPIR
jgi:hypothetical protein